MKVVHGGVAAPIGFKASGLYCGIKASKRKDLALIVSEKICDAVGAFTSNKVQASCVVINKEHLRDQKAQAIIANSGNANCMTGEAGFENSRTMAATVARALKLRKKDVLVASTGVIGKPLPIRKIVSAVPHLIEDLSRKGSENAAAAILTTDRVNKEMAVEFMIGKKRVRFAAIAKGAGMIHPEMTTLGKTSGSRHATMLCFATTDAAIAPAALREALDLGIGKSFNMVTIDGDMSTNDMVIILANGMAQNKKIVEGTAEFRAFARAAETVFLHLAKEMVRDAEGATKFVEVCVKNASSSEDARKAARSVTRSNLVKCALFGSDPNWGRIAAAVGYSGAHIDPWKLSIWLGKELVLKNGGRVKKSESVLRRVFAQKNIQITVDLALGRYSASAYTCDFSTSYVRINSAYRT